MHVQCSKISQAFEGKNKRIKSFGITRYRKALLDHYKWAKIVNLSQITGIFLGNTIFIISNPPQPQ